MPTPTNGQDVVRNRHSDTIKDMMRLGKDEENAVLSRGLRYHLEDRVIVHGNKTILLSNRSDFTAENAKSAEIPFCDLCVLCG
jgi:hypothetical protein